MAAPDGSPFRAPLSKNAVVATGTSFLVPKLHLGTPFSPKLCFAPLRAAEVKLRQQGIPKWNETKRD